MELSKLTIDDIQSDATNLPGVTIDDWILTNVTKLPVFIDINGNKDTQISTGKLTSNGM